MNALQVEAQRWFRQAQADLAVVHTLKSAGYYAALLDQFYIPTRYPNGLPSPAIPDETYTEIQAEAAQAAAKHVLSLVETFLRQHTEVLD